VATAYALRPPGDIPDMDPASGRHPQGYLQPLVGPLGRIIAEISIESDQETEIGAAELPEGSARAEAVAVLLRRAGEDLKWGEPVMHGSARAAERFAFERGWSSVDILRARPSLISEMQIGGWFNAGWRGRLARRLAVRAPYLAILTRTVVKRQGALTLSLDVWFWAGVRARATAEEWRRLTRSSYVALCYHQLSIEQLPTDWELDVPSSRFLQQLNLLKRLRYLPLTLDAVIRFHRDPTAVLGRRRFLLTADDGYRDAIDTLQRASVAHPISFVVTGFAAEAPSPNDADRVWGDGDGRVPAFADWERVREASRAGVAIGAHTRRHTPLVGCDRSELDDELVGARSDFEKAGVAHVPILAYPYGRHDLRVREAAAAAGYVLAYTTQPGRNGAGTDHWCLRRISIKPDDGALELVWKVLTGEALPSFLQRRFDRRRRSRASGRQLTG
jgi:peptidoglycan/xylan/chitin deacetylase (PgdA/CDA1 family)